VDDGYINVVGRKAGGEEGHEGQRIKALLRHGLTRCFVRIFIILTRPSLWETQTRVHTTHLRNFGSAIGCKSPGVFA
jgi:hypothetical protein